MRLFSFFQRYPAIILAGFLFSSQVWAQDRIQTCLAKIDQGDLKSARTMIDGYLDKDGEDVDMLSVKAVCLLMEGDTKGAAGSIEEVIASDSAGTLHMLATAFYFANTKKMQDAAASIVHADRFMTQQPPAYLPIVFSKLFEKKKFNLLAETILRHAEQYSVGDSVARRQIYERMAEHYEHRKLYEPALKYYINIGKHQSDIARLEQAKKIAQATEDDEPSPDEFVTVDVEPEPLTDLGSVIVYPEVAKRSGLEGKVIISALLDEEGNVTRLRVEVADYEIFVPSAWDALMQTRFSPARQGGEPIKVWYTVPVTFKLHK